MIILPKQKKRELNKNNFIETISKNLYLRKNYRERERRKEVVEKYKCSQMRNVLVGYEEIEETEGIEENE